MAYSHETWVTQTDSATRLSELRLHIAEVVNKIDNERGSDSFNVGSSSLVQYLARLQDAEIKLDTAVSRGSPVSRVRFDRAG